MLVKQILHSIETWPQLERRLARENNKTKGDVFEFLTKKYLQFHPNYSTKLKSVWLLKDAPLNILKTLHIPSNDQGIDLVCETRDGDFWSVQCKFISDTDKKISHRQISTFMSLSFGLSKKISYALICTTVDDYAAIYRGKDNIGFVLSDEWLKLGREFFDFARANTQRPPKRPVKLSPLPHQQKAIAAATKYFIKEKNLRGKLVFPCGAGKSLTGYWISHTLKAHSMVVAVPSLALVKQTLEVYLGQSIAERNDVRWLCVCSDEGIGKNDDIAIHTQDIGIPCVTDATTIASWLKKNKQNKTIIFTTYQSGRTLSEAAKKAGVHFDLGILDEAHKTVGTNDKLFSHLLFDKNIKIKRRIFMTATERRYRGNSNDIVSMDDVDLFGDTFEHMSFKHAVEANILSDYKIITLFVSNAEVETAIKQNGLTKDGLDARSYAALIALRKAMERYPIRHAVSFHGSIKKAEDFQSQQDIFSQKNKSFSPIETFHVSGVMPTAARSKRIQEFAKSAKALITNAKCLTEGVDVPGIDAVLFTDPRKSTVDIVQAVGRALRKSPGKKFGYVILPVFTENRDSAEILESDEFKEIIQTLRALASNDERIVEYFRDVSKGKRPKEGLLHFDIDVNVTAAIDEKQLIEELELHTWNRLAKLNWRPFEEAREFVRGLGLGGQKEWNEYTKSGNKPADIPVNPYKIYGQWLSFGDWLGTGRIAARDRIYRNFAAAKNFVRELNLKNQKEWQRYCLTGQKPDDIPASPEKSYKSRGWAGYGDWLGTGVIASGKQEYLSFEEARKFVRALGFKSRADWDKYSQSGQRPQNIPFSAHLVYRNKGWQGFGDWIGTGSVANFEKEYRPFNKARAFARRLKLQSTKEWKTYCQSGRKPENISASPHKTYLNKGWLGYGDWLGTGRIADHLKIFRDFQSARKFARSLKLKSSAEWNLFAKSGRKPADIPATPDKSYKTKGWKSYGDWLGTGTIAPNLMVYQSYARAKEYGAAHKISSIREWKKLWKATRLPNDLPSAPDKTYKDKGWKGWSEFFGRKNIFQQSYRSFESAKTFVQKLRFAEKNQWLAYCKSGKKPDDIPAKPERVFKGKGWLDYADWLGNGKLPSRDRSYRNFDEARNFVKTLNLKNQKDWSTYCKSGRKPADIPHKPERSYKNVGWAGLGDWLGTGTLSNRDKQYRDFVAARWFVRALKLPDSKAWDNYCRSGKKPVDIPAYPNQSYRTKGWISMGDWLGTGSVAASKREYRSFKAARAFVRKLSLQDVYAWQQYCKSGQKPIDIPANPERPYRAQGWKGYGDWLGTGNIANFNKTFRDFESVKAYFRKHKINGSEGWKEICRSGERPSDIPAAIERTYHAQWRGWPDFLGTDKKKRKPR